MNVLIALAFASSILLIYDGSVVTKRAPLRTRKRTSELMIPLPTLLLLASVTALVIGVLVRVTLDLQPVAYLAGLLGFSLPFTVERARRVDKQRTARAAWPDALTTLISGIRAGLSLPEALGELAESGSPLGPGFQAFRSTYRATSDFAVATESMKARLQDPIADRVAVALSIAYEVGGSDLVRVLQTLSQQTRLDIQIRREIEARWSWTVTAARLAATAPWLVLLLMASKPEGARAFAAPEGSFVILAGAIATIVGYKAMLKAGRLPEEGRLR